MSENKNYLGNAFSLQMLDLNKDQHITITPVTATEVANANFESCVGHSDTATILSILLGKEVACNRVSLHLHPGDILYVAQVIGGRLPEGTTKLPEGFEIKFCKVEMR